MQRTFGDTELWTESMKNGVSLIYVPEKFVFHLFKCYHSALIHPRTDRIHNTMHQHYQWKGMVKDIADYIKKCLECQRFIITDKKNYGKLPLITFDRSKPWDVVHIDMIGPWTVTFIQVKDNVTTEMKKEFKYLITVERTTSWLEFSVAKIFTAEHVALLLDKSWLCRYPQPKLVVHVTVVSSTNSNFRKWYRVMQ